MTSDKTMAEPPADPDRRLWLTVTSRRRRRWVGCDSDAFCRADQGVCLIRSPNTTTSFLTPTHVSQIDRSTQSMLIALSSQRSR